MMKFLKTLFTSLAAFLGFTSVSYAAVPASVTTGISDALADVGTIGAAILGVVIAIVAFGWLRRVIK